MDGQMCAAEHPANEQRPAGFLLIGAFFVFGAIMATYAGVTLLWPGTYLDRIWQLNPNAHIQLQAMGRLAGIPFLILVIALLLAAIGWFRRRYWGWLLGVAIVAMNLLGDIGNLLMGERLKAMVGLIIAGLLLYYLTRPRVRTYFLRG
jgi:hypothetical protein